MINISLEGTLETVPYDKLGPRLPVQVGDSLRPECFGFIDVLLQGYCCAGTWDIKVSSVRAVPTSLLSSSGDAAYRSLMLHRTNHSLTTLRVGE